MAKLNSAVAEKVDNAEDGFKPIPEGVYIVQLMEDVSVGEGARGAYWKWTFEIPTEHEGNELQHSGRRFWTNTSLSEESFWKLKEAFTAFGVATDTDTEDLVGKRVKAHISVEVAKGGQRKGEPVNSIKKLLPLDTESEAPAATGVSTAKASAPADEPMF
jgi:hypothetical protein